MTTTTTTAANRNVLLAALGAGTGAVFTAVGTFWDITGNEPDGGHTYGEYLVVLGIIAVATAAVFGLVVRGADAHNAARRSVILGALAAAAFVVFWSGLPTVLAAGATATALVDRDRTGRFSTQARIGLGLAAVAVVAAGVLCVVG